MRISTSVAILLALFAGGSPGTAASANTIKLTVGQTHRIHPEGGGIKTVVLGDRNVVDLVAKTASEVTIVGVGGGTSMLTVVRAVGGSTMYTVTVTEVETKALLRQVKSYLGRIEGIYAQVFDDTVVLSGNAITVEDYGRAQRAVELFGTNVKNRIRFRSSAVEQVNQIFAKSGLSSVKANLIGGTLFLEGAVSSEDEMKKVNALLGAFGLNAENLLVMGGGRQVLIDVQFVEMRKSGFDNIGVSYPASIGVGSRDPNQPIGTVQAQIPITPSGQSNVSMNLLAPIQVSAVTLNMLFSSGKARLLARPKLVCGSGKTAEFLVGGEVPVVLVTAANMSINWKEYGIKLKITPVADSLGYIRSDVLAEVSEVDDSVAVQNIPGFRTRRFNTNVSVKEGSSIVLSGLFSNSEQKSVAKLPLLGHIPIIGELFKSRQFREQKTTLVVFLTPKVVSAEHTWVQESIGDIQRMYNSYESEVGWQLFD